MIDESSCGLQRARHRKREREREPARDFVSSFPGQICTRADLSILITKTSEKKAEIKEGSRARERERRHLLETTFFTPKRNDERDQKKKDEETRKPEGERRVRLLRVRYVERCPKIHPLLCATARGIQTGTRF